MTKYLFPFIFVAMLAMVAPRFAVAQPPWGGGDSGGDRGGRGGDRGSDRGGFGGGPPGGGYSGRGGDPSSFIDGLDRNKNGMLDPDELQGPAQFMISRMQRDDPSIRTDRPIPMSKIKESFEKMRSSRESGGDDRGRGSDRDRERNEDESRRQADQKVSENMIAKPLVPGFGLPDDQPLPEPVLGFGSSAELMAVEVTPQDQKDAEDNLRRYDRNRDGSLAQDELSRRLSGNPLDFDRNGDKKLSLNELAIRAARKRIIENSPEVAAIRGDIARRTTDTSQKSAVDVKDPYNGRKSYLANSRELPDGLPGWFATKDRNGDTQIEMSEYTDAWSNAVVEEFMRFDTNGDGVITVKECITGVEAGVSASAAVASSSSPIPVSSSTSSYPTPSTSVAVTNGESKSAPVTDEKMMSYATKIIGRNDKNGDGALTASEWKEMIVDPSPADADKDGRVTIPEYAAYMQAKSTR